MNIKRNKSQQGFTLVELIIGMMIIAIIMVPLSTMIRTYADTWLRGGTRGELQSVARTTMDAIQKDLAYARNVTISADGRRIEYRDERDEPDRYGYAYYFDVGGNLMKQRTNVLTGISDAAVMITGANTDLRINSTAANAPIRMFSNGPTASISVVVDLRVRSAKNGDSVQLRTVTNTLGDHIR